MGGGGTELVKGRWEGFLTLPEFQRLQQVRRLRTRTTGQNPVFKVYPLSGAVCGECGGQVTAAGKGRMRCRKAANHGACQQPSATASKEKNDALQVAVSSNPRNCRRRRA